MFTLHCRLFAGALLSVSLLCDCAGGTSTAIPSNSVDLAALSSSQPDARMFGKWVYLAQLYGEDLVIYRRVGISLQYDTTLKQGVVAPQGTIATINGWWYVANGGAANVLVYRSSERGPSRKPVTTLNDPGEFAANVYATPNRRLVAVSNATSSSSAAGSVSVYLNRESNPARILTFGSDPLQGTGVAIDHQGNCYWAFNDPNTRSGSIVQFAGCQGSGTIVQSGIGNAQGIAFDQSGNLYYIDEANATIYKCKKISNCNEKFTTDVTLPVNMNFDQKSKHLWVADASGYMYAFDTKSGKRVYEKAGEGGPTDPPSGIAPAPGG